MASGVELRFPAPAKAPSENEFAFGNNATWAKRKRMLEPWRDAVGWAWKMVPPAMRNEVQGTRCRVHVTIAFPQKRRRDPHNYTGTIVKAAIDQLVAMDVWPDDTPEWVVTTEPVLVVGGDCVIRLEPLT